MNVKKLVSRLLAGVVIVVACMGCKGDKESSNKNKTNLTFWTLSTKRDALDPIVEKFNQDNSGIEMKVSFFDTDGLKDALKVAAASDTLPNMWFNWGGALGGFYTENGLTYDFTEYAETHGWESKFNPGVLSLCTLSDQLAGYPQSYNVLGIYYRKDIFKQYEIKVPETFEEFEIACETLKANGIIPISTAGQNGWHVMRLVELFIEHYVGADMHDSLNTFKVSWDNPQVVKALEKYKEFVDKGYLPEGFVTFNPNDTQLLIYSGQAAMDIQGPWYDGMIISEGQDINNYGVFSFPSGGTNRMSAFAEMIQFTANNTEAKIEAGVKFLEFYFSDTNVDKYSEFYNLPLPLLHADMPAGQPNVAILLNSSAKTGTFTITDQAFTPEIARALFDVQDGIAIGDISPKEGAVAIQKAIEKSMSK